MNLEKFAEKIVALVGGEKNVMGLSHCATRLRFTLKNNKKADIEKIKELEGVLGVVSTNAQLQVIVGNQVDRYYDAIMSMYHFEAQDTSSEEKAEGNLFMRAIAVVPKVFGPVLPLLTASGMVKVLLTLLAMFKVLPTDNQTYIILNYVSDICFYFLPIFVAV
ncbi:MAG: PTS transporter subunit EIIB, partial [Erysipelotrichaceae bacterium]|nr:PTS transporter subunit EIIB [Erysipelotrichaceae bacterium]